MSNLLSSFTRDGQRVVDNARKIIKTHNQDVIGSQHLLLGLLQLSGSQAEAALRKCYADLESLKTRLAASIKMQARHEQVPPQVGFPPEVGYTNRQVKFSLECTSMVNEAIAEAETNTLDFVDPRLLILGMLRTPHSEAGQFLAQYGITLEQFRTHAKLKENPVVDLPRFQTPKLSASRTFLGISPIFIILVLFTAMAGAITYIGIGNSQAAMFFFLIGGWIISVALHEFGHAIVAYWGGDKSVVDKGYLSLNPLKYTHPFLSIVLPVIFVIMGGIGLPGGAVYIHPAALKNNFFRSLTSAAGPIASALCALVLVMPFLFFKWVGYEFVRNHFEFWAGIALLGFLQITAIIINLLPIPGLDGYGIAEPFLPEDFARTANLIRPFGILILLVLLFMDTPLRTWFWDEVWGLVMWIDPVLAALASEGLELMRFWA